MNNRFLILLFALFVGFSTSVNVAQADVIQYYKELQKIKHLGLAYPLRAKGKKWLTTNGEWHTAIPVTVDLKNGYIFFSDEGTGGGNFDTQVVLYRKSDKSPLIGIVENGYDPPYPGQAKVRFFSRGTKNWENETAWVWPKIAVDDFLTPDMTIADLRSLKTIGAVVYVKLPRKGTAAMAYLIINEDIAQAVCRGDPSIVVGNVAPYQDYCQRLKGRMFNRIEILWNKQEGRFSKGKKSRGPRP